MWRNEARASLLIVLMNQFYKSILFFSSKSKQSYHAAAAWVVRNPTKNKNNFLEKDPESRGRACVRSKTALQQAPFIRRFWKATRTSVILRISKRISARTVRPGQLAHISEKISLINMHANGTVCYHHQSSKTSLLPPPKVSRSIG